MDMLSIVTKTFLDSILKKSEKIIYYCLHYTKFNNSCFRDNHIVVKDECKDCPNRLIPNPDDPGRRGAVGGG